MQILIFTLFGLVGPVPFASSPPRPLSRSRNHPTALTTVPEGQLPVQNRRCFSTEQTNWYFWWDISFEVVGEPDSGLFILWHGWRYTPCPSTEKTLAVSFGTVSDFSERLFWHSPTRKPKIGSCISILHFVSNCPQDCRFRLVIERMGT